MKQSALHRCIARKTGESVQRIQRMGFRILVVPNMTSLAEQKEHTLDVNAASVKTHSSQGGPVLPPA
jgi:hypothetical protein